MMDIEATRTRQGNTTHARYAGSQRTLCGKRAFGRVFAEAADDPEQLVSCHRCRRVAGWSYQTTAPLGRTTTVK